MQVFNQHATLAVALAGTAAGLTILGLVVAGKKPDRAKTINRAKVAVSFALILICVSVVALTFGVTDFIALSKGFLTTTGLDRFIEGVRNV